MRGAADSARGSQPKALVEVDQEYADVTTPADTVWLGAVSSDW